jgi:predicted Zn-dependent protease with MMP-like domain
MAHVLFLGSDDPGLSGLSRDAFERIAAGRHGADSAAVPTREQADRADVVVTVGPRGGNADVAGRRYIHWNVGDWEPGSEEAREEIEARAEQLLAELDAAEDPDLAAFESLVVDAIDRLPEEFQKVLERVAVIVSDLGADARAYGQYFGDGVTRGRYEDRIVIYRDTLERDFGHDRALLAQQVERTLRHELAHHLGWNERGVGGLGL